MVSAQPAEIMALLRSGEPVEIGMDEAAARERAKAPRRFEIILGFAAIYLIWGSTYLAIRYAVESIPPLLMMGVRHLTAGVVVYTWARHQGVPSPTRRQWFYGAIAGMLLFLGGHGTLAWAEQRVPSGLAALLCATLPLWTVMLGRLQGTEKHLSRKAWCGILVGFIGVAILIGPDLWHSGSGLNLLATLAALGSSFLWAVGTLYTKRMPMPSSSVLAASTQMVTGGVWLLLAGFLAGEGQRVQLSSLTFKSVAALAYLTVFGSIIAFTAFTWLLTVASPSRVSTYAYVNPVVAVFLGWLLASETIGAHTVIATAIILAAVAMVNTRGKAPINERPTATTRELEEAV